ncbi:hypothetical protein F2Q69_00028989 [Brassica cretica]|uniref:Uncharacterized protein n=1 Tax=Brassica cretica TaxID=69181 RepID=A0A8S9S5F9_BRACR|nr:hypothetical protein F2Q69_00028989 [Brassica cretica]
MGEETQAALMQALRDLQQEMKNMRQELGGRMDRIEQRPAIRPQRRVDLGTAQANTTPTGTAPRRTGLHFNDIPEASNTHQQPEDEPGPFYPQNQNQRRAEEQDEEDEDFLPRPRAPRRQNRNQGTTSFLVSELKFLQHQVYITRGKAAMGEETQAALMQALRDLQEEMKNMRQEIGGRMDRIEQRPAIRSQRRVDLGTAQAITTPTGTAPRRTGVHFNDIPEASNTHQQPEDDPGPFYPQNQNQRRT